MESCSACEEESVKIPLNIFVPSRGSTTTTHSDSTPQTVVGFALPKDELMENLLLTLTGRNADGSVRVAFQIPIMVSNRQADTPNAYTVDQGTQSSMTNEDPDLEADVVANGDAGVNLRVTDDSGDAGVITWKWQIWVLDQLLLV